MMTAKRIALIDKTQTRLLLEMDVSACNSPLKCRIKRMSNIDLLRNCHPIYRLDYAKQLFEEGEITKQELNSIRKINVDNYYGN